MQLEGSFDAIKADHTGERFIVLPSESQDQFRKTLDLLKVTRLEIALMYRNAGNIRGPITDYRDSLISYLFYLLTTGKPLTRHTVTLFNEESEPAQAPTGRDRTVAYTVAPAKVTSAPRSNNRVLIFEFADRMWNDKGAPKDSATVLALRKTIMAELELQHGIKKTTSSTALGEWQKLRLNA